jgi:SAM-dependent methyltransferase
LTHIPAVLTGIARHARNAGDRVNLGFFSKVLHRKVVVERFNTLLDDEARLHYAPAIKTLWRVVPRVMRRKIPRANVQQGFMLAAVEQLADGDRTKKMLCVGSFEDTACYALQSLGYRIDAIDPSLNVDLTGFRRQHPERLGTYDIVFSTSVIEHVPDDETFVADMVAMLAPGGYAVLTCDYNDTWTPDQPKPPSDVRIYTRSDIQRLIAAMGDVELLDEPDWQDHDPDFTIAEYGIDMHYGFATLTVRRR